jgi:arylsulfatase A-like enzyme
MVIDFSKNNFDMKIASEFNNQLDVAPTILELLKLPKPKTWLGNSIYKKRKTDYIFLQEKDYYSCIWNQGGKIFQYIYNSRKKTDELFNITTSKNNEVNLISSFNKTELLKAKDTLANFYELKIKL